MTYKAAAHQTKNNLEALIQIAATTTSTTDLIRTYINTTPLLNNAAKAAKCTKPTTITWIIAINLLTSPITNETIDKAHTTISYINHLIKQTPRTQHMTPIDPQIHKKIKTKSTPNHTTHTPHPSASPRQKPHYHVT